MPFKDLNNDGVDEMIIANQQTDGSYFADIHYLASKTDSASWRFRRWHVVERAMRINHQGEKS